MSVVDWINAKAERLQQQNEFQKTIYQSQILYAEYGWIVLRALTDVPGIIQPVDLSEVFTANNVPRRFVYRVVIARGAGSNQNVIANVKNAVYNEISKTFNVSLADVRKTLKVDCCGDNILITY